MPAPKKYTVLDLFSGVGGLSYAFHNSDWFDVLVANEILPEPAKTYCLNNPNTKMYNCDIKYFSLETVYKDTGIKILMLFLAGLLVNRIQPLGREILKTLELFYLKNTFAF